MRKQMRGIQMMRNQMRFNEWTRNKQSLFSEIFDGLELPEGFTIAPEQLDSTFNMLYGDRFVPSKLTDMTVKEVASHIKTLYNKKWIDNYKLLSDEFNLGVSSSVKVTNTEKTTGKDSSNRKSQGNVSAFDNDDYVPDDENLEEFENERENDVTGSRETETRSIWAIQQQMSMLEQSVEKRILDDVAKVITLPLY